MPSHRRPARRSIARALSRVLGRSLPFALACLAAHAGAARAQAPAAAATASPAAGATGATGFDRGVRAFEARQYTAARSELLPFAKSNPRHAGAAYYLGRAFYADTSWDDATKWLEKAVELEPQSSQYHLWLGNAYGAQAQRANKLRQGFVAKKVKNEFERAAALDPNNLDAREGLMQFYLQAPGFMGGSVDKAKAEVAEIARRSPYRGHFASATLYRRQKDTAAAGREWQQLVRDFPDSAAGYYNLAGYYQSGGQVDKAFATLDELRQRRPKDMAAVYSVGRLGAATGQQLDRAEQSLRAYLQYAPGPNEPTHAGAHWRLGQIHEKRGDKAAARAEYETALRMDPKLKGAQESLKALK
ncbi:MAG TPA: tetratricopeptide repeat protein [Gemmatimonadaceae bacterium]|nr:tetratricopeptide repeat protein [Gemmatimonadaceae bacterium]